MINEAFFSNFIIEDLKYDDSKIQISLKSKNSSSKCPLCGQESSKVHSKYLRRLMDLPMIDKCTKIMLACRRFYCINDECERKIFSEQFDKFITKYKRKTERLCNYLVKFGISQSASQGCRVIKELIPISVSSLLRVVQNHKIEVKYDAKYIGIDDFSFKRGVTFGTLICDLKTGKPIDVINSRNLAEVTEHLKLYKNVQLVSRDRSTTYAKAISDAIPAATQVADRFHIIHNFFEGISDFLKGYIGKSINIDINENNSQIEKDKNIVTVKNKTEIKRALILKIKDLHKSGIPIKAIVRDLSISRNTVRKYINLEDVSNLNFHDKFTPFNMYKVFIQNLLIEKKTYKEVLQELAKKGVNYSYSSIAKYAGALKKDGLPEQALTVKSYIFTRFNLIKIFWNHKNTPSDLFKILKLSLVEYPLIDTVFFAIATLKEVFDSKSALELKEWIDFNKASTIKEIRSFINGVKKDYASVENSVILKESNGILEGNVNRLKMIKRSMFGRAGFDLLRKKVLFNI